MYPSNATQCRPSGHPRVQGHGAAEQGRTCPPPPPRDTWTAEHYKGTQAIGALRDAAEAAAGHLQRDLRDRTVACKVFAGDRKGCEGGLHTSFRNLQKMQMAGALFVPAQRTVRLGVKLEGEPKRGQGRGAGNASTRCWWRPSRGCDTRRRVSA